MPDFGKRLRKLMAEHRYMSLHYLNEICPLEIGCSKEVLEKYIKAGLSLNEFKMYRIYLAIEPLERVNDEVFPWEKA